MENLTYTWDCKTVDILMSHNDLNDVVYNVHWRYRLSFSDSELFAEIIGTQSLSLDDIDADAFMPLSQLTNEVLASWVESAIGEEEILRMQSSLKGVLTEQLTPTKQTIRIEE